MKFIYALVFLCLSSSVHARCKMRANCAFVGGFQKPCAVDMEAAPFTDHLSPEEAQEAADVFTNICPDQALDENGNPRPPGDILTCCDYEQIVSLRNNFLLAEGVLGRCPACMRNFARQICEMNCSPDQSRFVDVYPEVSADGSVYVDEIDYRILGSYLDDAFASCAGVIMPQTGLPAVNMMCGSAAVCDADAFFGFTGDTSQNPMVPVQVNFLRSNDSEQAMSLRAPSCNEALEGDIPCSCVDCFAMCPLGTEPVPPQMCTIGSIDCIGFSVAITVFVISVTIFILLTLREYRNLRQGHKERPTPSATPEVNKLTGSFQLLFSKIGLFSANNPALIIMLTSWLGFALLFGVLNIDITYNPIELWSSPESRSRQELNYFNSRFGPFYRASQVFMVIDLEPFQFNNYTYGPAYRIEALTELVQLEDRIFNVGREEGIPFESVCYAPNRLPGDPQLLTDCVYMSPSIYLGNQRNNINNETYMNNVQNCLNNFYGFSCLADWGGGSDPELTMGGFTENIQDATALIMSFPLANHLLQANLEPALEWETMFLDMMHDYEHNRKSDFVSVSFYAERSVEDELIRVSVAEAVPIVVSYIVMFVYVIIALGNMRSYKTWLIDSRITLAVGSFIVVILAIFCATGVMGYAGITITLLSLNVIPFFILSVGIDNVFLMVNTIQDIQNNLKHFEDYTDDMDNTSKRDFIFGKMLARVGPSMFVSSITQITCFAIGTLSNFPAVRSFALFCSISLTFLFLLQITTVVALISIDFKRASKNRFDVLCCIRKKVLDDEDPLNSDAPYKSLIHRLMVPYSEFILNWKVKICVMIVFFTMLSVSIMFIPGIEVGLDQEMALPQDSYVYKYLQTMAVNMNLGPPVYFVLKSGLNFTDINHQNAICGGQMCHEESLVTQIFLASRYSDVTYISRSSNSWLDDFIDWTGLTGACCQYNTTEFGFCPSSENSEDCAYCEIDRKEWSNGLRPTPEAFETYIPFFLLDEPTDICSKGGLASYGSGVNYLLDSEGRATVTDSNFMAYHSSLVTSQDYIKAVTYGYEISENITRSIRELTGVDVEVFPYSVFYVFFEQYLTMWRDNFVSLGYCFIGAMIFNLLASGFFIISTFTVMFTSMMIVVDMMGIMYFWNIPLNPISNINLIVSIGIAVEFCSHLAYAFDISNKQGDEKVKAAIQSVGATIITGITFTNIPIIVLAFSYTEVIEVFFFRMLFSLVILGFLHGMIFYPVFLSYMNNLKSKSK